MFIVASMGYSEETDWIRERANCNIRVLFQNFRSLVQRNVEAVHKEYGERGWEAGFKYTAPDETIFTILRQHPSMPGKCQFQYHEETDRIVVTITAPIMTYTIRTRWDAKESKCQIVVTWPVESADEPSSKKEKKLEFPHDPLWKVVQCVLEPFFFTESLSSRS